MPTSVSFLIFTGTQGFQRGDGTSPIPCPASVIPLGVPRVSHGEPVGGADGDGHSLYRGGVMRGHFYGLFFFVWLNRLPVALHNFYSQNAIVARCTTALSEHSYQQI